MAVALNGGDAELLEPRSHAEVKPQDFIFSGRLRDLRPPLGLLIERPESIADHTIFLVWCKVVNEIPIPVSLPLGHSWEKGLVFDDFLFFNGQSSFNAWNNLRSNYTCSLDTFVKLLSKLVI